ncbi:hypothetical protein LCGC14_2540230 [marine sediment metagenome]|uniref:Uncharacterized protein n=1 Tax=marine sediment metagenome TaxID=412755 RepID=A0A0F9ARC7_9ZZZZ
MAKKKSTTKSSKVETAVPTTLSKSVRIEKISNGFVISTFTDKGEKAAFGKTRKDAEKIALKMLK